MTQTKTPERPATKEERAEVKRKKSIELAEKRVSKVFNALRQMGNLASANYNLTKDEIEAMFKGVENCVAEQEARFEQPYVQKPEGFRFNDWLIGDNDNVSSSDEE